MDNSESISIFGDEFDSNAVLDEIL
jgi:hypothetical protein